MTYTIIIRVKVIKTAAANPPTNRPPPTAGDSDIVSQSVQVLVTVSCIPSTTIENGTCLTILSAMIEAVSDPLSDEYSKVAV